ncbi:acyl carrier protein [Rhizohabitans arisaemae]|uniref:acyl carrier protein n=1 Tax=Rhizohabitans arisaemae TaxID=2720610 RepID=UPI0024B12B12|nr:acyl carrier protein [Rhizohabitans arisaemae]
MTQGLPPIKPTGSIVDQVGDLVEAKLGRQIGLDESFFEAGLNSLALVDLHEEITGKLGVDMPITTLFRYPNLRLLGGYLKDSGANARQAAPERSSRPIGGSRRDIRSRLRKDG